MDNADVVCQNGKALVTAVPHEKGHGAHGQAGVGWLGDAQLVPRQQHHAQVRHKRVERLAISFKEQDALHQRSFVSASMKQRQEDIIKQISRIPEPFASIWLESICTIVDDACNE